MCHLCEMQSKLKRAADITESIAEMGSALYDDAITDAFNALDRASNLLDHECEKDRHEAQIIRLNDWMSSNEPDIYWGGEGDDTASAILRVIEKYRARIDELERQLSAPPSPAADFGTIDAMCERCGWGPHLHTSIGALDVQVCKRCNIGRVNQ